MLNNKTQFFVSWSFDPEAQFTDAFSISWENFEPYIFPPFCLIAKVLNKIKEDNVKRAILVVPFLAYSNMVLNINFSVDFSPCYTASSQKFTDSATYRRDASTLQEDVHNRVCCIWKSLIIKKNFKIKCLHHNTSSWRKSTNKQYKLCWRK